ncbi:GNAT family N-acetyltransferase [Candidatus Peregrinibacteria bacterium]|nr:GNAT family N-acetyltransferase [Candidatus Peregrinibacteria bacterium]
MKFGDKNYWNHGVGSNAINLLTKYAFEEMGIEEINLGVISENLAARRIYEKCGFQIEKINEKIAYDQIWMVKKYDGKNN